MKMVTLLQKGVIGVGAAITLVTALPIAGGVGVITAAGTTIASVIGVAAVVVDAINEEA